MFLLMILFSLIFSYAEPQSQEHETRGPGKLEPSQRIIPVQETHRGLEVNWTQLLAMLTILAGVHAFGMRYIVTPAIVNAIQAAVSPIQTKVAELDKTLDKLKQEMDLRVKDAEDVHERFHEALRDLRKEFSGRS